jgi:hypothetical protein
MFTTYTSKIKVISDFSNLLKERIEKANPRRPFTSEETKRLTKLEAIATRLKRGENVQNRSLKTQDTRKELRI